ncbi:MAG: hypothetical protein RLP44_30900 [Aggregatilineales bacterium]
MKKWIIVLFCAFMVSIMPVSAQEQFASAVEWSPDFSRLAIGYNGGGLAIFETATDNPIRDFSLSTADIVHITEIQWHPTESNILAVIVRTIGQDEAYILNSANGEIIDILEGFERQSPNFWVTNLSWNTEDNLLAVSIQIGIGSFSSSHQVLIYDTQSMTSPELITVISEIPDSVAGLAWKPESSLLVIVSATGYFYVWDQNLASAGTFSVWDQDLTAIDTRLQLPTGISDVVWSVDGSLLAGVNTLRLVEQTIYIFDAEDWSYYTIPQPFGTSGIAWNSNSSEFVVNGGGGIVTIDARNGKILQQIYPNRVLNAVWNENGAGILYAENSGVINEILFSSD